MATEVKTTIPGNMWKVFVKEGDIVKKGDPLFIMEVMKTEVHHDSPVDGKVRRQHQECHPQSPRPRRPESPDETRQ